MSRARTIVFAIAATFAWAAPAAPQSGCAPAIANFRAVIDSDANTGNLNNSVYNRIVPELDRIAATCRAGRDAEATRALAAIERRYGYH